MNRQSIALSLGASALILFSAFAVPAFAAESSSSAPLPEALRPTVYRALAKDAGPAYAIGRDACAALPKQSLRACFEKGGVHFDGKNVPALALRLASYGRGGQLMPVKPVAAIVHANRAAYKHGNVTEWWRVLPMGFEQGFTVAKRPTGQGELTLALAASRGAASHGEDLAWGKLSYGKLVVTDAKGHVVPATLKNEGNRILIAVNDARAAYPLTVDPLVWLEQKVTASDGMTYDNFGFSVALDGITALIASSYATVNGNSGQGAVYVLNESNGTWTFTQKLTASDGSAGAEFGTSVAFRGTTAIIGAPSSAVGGNQPGSVYVFSDSGGTWTQTQEFSASDDAPGDRFGHAVAFDGTTVLVGAPNAKVNGTTNKGAAYVFMKLGGTWNQTEKLVNSDTNPRDFGWAVAVDGTNVLIGAGCSYYDEDGCDGGSKGYAFAETDGTWNQVAIPQGGGSAVALSGNVAVMTKEPYYPNDSGFTQGTATIYTLSQGTWSQVAEFHGNLDGDETDDYGHAAAISGNTVLVGADYNGTVYFHLPGKVYEYTDSSGWVQTQVFSASDGADGDMFGNAIALSGASALIGAHFATVNGDYFEGAAYFESESDLDLAMSAPANVPQGSNYVAQAIATNAGSAASPAVAVTVSVPAAASFVSANATQGSCSEDSGVVTCAFGQIAGNGGTATANVTLKATGDVGATIENTASVARATPELSAGADTTIVSAGACPDGYSQYDGTLAAHARAIEPDGEPYEAPAGSENGILFGPDGFRLYAAYRGAGDHWQLFPAGPGNAIHHSAPAGTFAWIVKAGAAGGAFTFCLKHP